MTPLEVQRDGFVISTDPARLQLDVVHSYLSDHSYWAQGRSREAVRTSIEHSLCFGVYTAAGEQVGFGRVVTDYATFGWLCDVFILEAYRGHALGKWLIETVTAHPALQPVSRLLLATRDAHELYRRYGGFESLPHPERWMVRVKRAYPR
jgi:GNAT superfamily N-acetyltransferase